MISALLEQTNVVFPGCFFSDNNIDLYDWIRDYLGAKSQDNYFEFTIHEKYSNDGCVYYYIEK